MRKEIVNSGLLTHLARFYPDTCTIKTYTSENQDSFGQPDPSWIDLTGYVDIPCAVAAKGGKEVKMSDMEYAVSTHTIALAGCYTGIQTKMRAVVNSITYEVLYSEVDSHSKMTRVTCRIVV